MNTFMIGHQLELTEALKAHVEEKLAASVAPFVDDSATRLEVTLSRQVIQSGDVEMHCQVNLVVPHMAPIAVHKMSTSMYGAIDLAHHALVEQVRSRRDRQHDLHKVRREAERQRAEIARQALTTHGDRPQR